MTKSLAVHHHETLEPHADTRTPDPHQDSFSKTVLGFWVYLMTDCILFGALFATYAVLHSQTFGGPSSQDIFDLSLAFGETLLLLCSSVTCGFAMLSAVNSQRIATIGWLTATFLLGSLFLAIELHEFSQLIDEGHSWTKSAFLSSFFTLVGTHGLHITVGLFWMVVLMLQLFFEGIQVFTFRRLVIFSLFWHFLDLVWIFIFTFVYLMGVV